MEEDVACGRVPEVRLGRAPDRGGILEEAVGVGSQAGGPERGILA